MKQHKAVTITREEAIKDIKVVVIGILKDNVVDLVDSGDGLLAFEHYSNIPEKPIKEIGDMWAELCAEKFLKTSPDVTDVLLLEEEGDVTVKSWLASK